MIQIVIWAEHSVFIPPLTPFSSGFDTGRGLVDYNWLVGRIGLDQVNQLIAMGELRNPTREEAYGYIPYQGEASNFAKYEWDARKPRV
jgi:hypothetical protein